MKTAKERESAFRKDLAALLDKHGAELDIDDDGLAWRAKITVIMNSRYCDDSEMTHEHREFDL